MSQTDGKPTENILGSIFSLAVRGRLTCDGASRELISELVRKHHEATSEEKTKYVQAIFLSIDAIKDPEARFKALQGVNSSAAVLHGLGSVLRSDLEMAALEKALPMIDTLPPEKRYAAAYWVWAEHPEHIPEAVDKAFIAIDSLPIKERLEAAQWVREQAPKGSDSFKGAEALIKRLKTDQMSIDLFIAEMQALPKPQGP